MFADAGLFTNLLMRGNTYRNSLAPNWAENAPESTDTESCWNTNWKYLVGKTSRGKKLIKAKNSPRIDQESRVNAVILRLRDMQTEEYVTAWKCKKRCIKPCDSRRTILVNSISTSTRICSTLKTNLSTKSINWKNEIL